MEEIDHWTREEIRGCADQPSVPMHQLRLDHRGQRAGSSFERRRKPLMQFWYLLIGLVVAAIGVALVILVALPAMRRRLAAVMAGSFSLPSKPLNALSWIQVLPDNRIHLLVPKAEMGQGIHTGLAQIAAEELEVPLEWVEVTHASTRQGENTYRGTFGSESIHGLYDPLRRAAATMREMLRAEASLRLGVPPENLVACNGHFEIIGRSKRASLTALWWTRRPGGRCQRDK